MLGQRCSEDINAALSQGYRPVSGSVKVSLKSLGYTHNETASIFSHLIPAVLALLLLIWGFWRQFDVFYPLAHKFDKLMFVYYFSSVFI